MSRWARRAKADKNQAEIVQALRAAGATVQLLHAVGSGCPDLLVGMCRRNFLLEVKNLENRHGMQRKNGARSNATTAAQRLWHAGWRGEVKTVHSVDEALAAIGVIGRVG
jgi:hypothetical protein